MKLNLDASVSELMEYDEESLTQRIIEVAPLIARSAFIDSLSKSERADTPAEPHERIRGSKKNPKGSARSESSASAIELSDAVISALEEDVREHNEKADEPWKRVTLAKLKAVWRRGAGAFSATHRPSQNRQSWAFARVKAFRRIVMGGGNPKYVQDDDLLHTNHPRRRTRKAHDPSCCGDHLNKAETRRGGEIDLVAELAESMQSLYTSRLDELQTAINKIDLSDTQE